MIIGINIPNIRAAEVGEAFGLMLSDYPSVDDAKEDFGNLIGKRIANRTRTFHINKQRDAVTFDPVEITYASVT